MKEILNFNKSNDKSFVSEKEYKNHIAGFN